MSDYNGAAPSAQVFAESLDATVFDIAADFAHPVGISLFGKDLKKLIHPKYEGNPLLPDDWEKGEGDVVPRTLMLTETSSRCPRSL